MGISSGSITRAIDAFDQSRAPNVFSTCEQILKSEWLKIVNFAVLQQAVNKKWDSAKQKVADFSYAPPRQQKMTHIFSYFDCDAMDPEKRQLIGFTCAAIPSALEVTERPFPFEIYDKRVAKVHLETSQYPLVYYADDHFNWMTALSIAMAQTLKDGCPDHISAVPVALPGRRGLFLGYAERIEQDFFAPLTLHFQHCGRNELSEQLRAMPFESPEFMITIDGFLSVSTLEKQGYEAERKIKQMLDRLYLDDAKKDATLNVSDTYFMGGRQRQRLINTEIYGKPETETNKTLAMQNLVLEEIASILISEAWRDFSCKNKKYLPTPPPPPLAWKGPKITATGSPPSASFG